MPRKIENGFSTDNDQSDENQIRAEQGDDSNGGDDVHDGAQSRESIAEEMAEPFVRLKKLVGDEKDYKEIDYILGQLGPEVWPKEIDTFTEKMRRNTGNPMMQSDIVEKFKQHLAYLYL